MCEGCWRCDGGGCTRNIEKRKIVSISPAFYKVFIPSRMMAAGGACCWYHFCHAATALLCHRFLFNARWLAYISRCRNSMIFWGLSVVKCHKRCISHKRLVNKNKRIPSCLTSCERSIVLAASSPFLRSCAWLCIRIIRVFACSDTNSTNRMPKHSSVPTLATRPPPRLPSRSPAFHSHFNNIIFMRWHMRPRTCRQTEFSKLRTKEIWETIRIANILILVVSQGCRDPQLQSSCWLPFCFRKRTHNVLERQMPYRCPLFVSLPL